MNYLLDVNILVAWGWADHTDHKKVARWIAKEHKKKKSLLLTSAIPELGFVRISVQRSQGEITPQEATHVLQGMLHVLGKQHHFLPDDLQVDHWPKWCLTATRTTDAHLFSLAEKHGALLATLDQDIPGAFVVE